MTLYLRFFELNTGAKIPSVGLGTAQIVGEAVTAAVKDGYRHIDCASVYGNEKEIGCTLKKLFDDGVVKREELFITSKLWNSDHAPEDVPKALDRTLQDLQLDYLDLYLIHWPVRMKAPEFKTENLTNPDIPGTWNAMEALYDSGKARAIGVSNFSSKKLRDLLEIARVPPAVNQVECHPVWQQGKLHEFCKSKAIHITGYSPLGSSGIGGIKNEVLKNPILNMVAEKLGKSPAQVALRWGLQMGHSVLPKSSNETRIKQNFDVFDWSIPEDLFAKFSEIEQIEALKAIGVTEVVLAINYQPEVMLNFLKEYEKKLDIKITCSQETEPLGTAGPLALARDKLIDDSGDPFFVLNSDVISEYPLKEMIQFHKSHGMEASIMVTKVEEPSKYGVVVMEESTGRVEKFVEKPKVFVGNKINAGIYLLNPSVLEKIELRPTSIEKEVFPKIAAEKQLYAMVLPGFWMDIGQPKDYISGLRLYLDSLRKGSSPHLASGAHIIGNVLVDESAIIGDGCLIGPDVAIGPGCVIEPGVRLSRCSVMRGVRIKKHACISGSIIGWHSTVGRWARVENMTILGEDVHIGDEVYTNGGVVLPHKEIKSSILKPQIVM